MTFLHILWLSPFILGPLLWVFVFNASKLPAALIQLRAKLRGAVRSKTVWVNGVALLCVQSLPDLVDYLAQNLPAAQPYLPANHYTSAMGAITIANIILRFKTTRSLETK